jgi:hypothetical protein
MAGDPLVAEVMSALGVFTSLSPLSYSSDPY